MTLLADLKLQETSQTIARNGVSTLIHHEEFDSFGSPGTYGDIPSGWLAYEAGLSDVAKHFRQQSANGIIFHLEQIADSTLRRVGINRTFSTVANKPSVVTTRWRRTGNFSGNIAYNSAAQFSPIPVWGPGPDLNSHTLNEWRTSVSYDSDAQNAQLLPHLLSSANAGSAEIEIDWLTIYDELAGVYARDASNTTIAGPGGSIPLAYNPNGTSDFVDIDGTGAALPASGSIAVWIKDLSSGNKAIVAKGVSDQVMLFNESTSLKLRVGGTGSDLTWSHSDTSGWHLYGATWDSETGKIYKDGVEVASGTVNATPSNNSKKWRIGQFDATTGGYYLSHPVAGVKIYDEILDATDFAAFYAEGAPQNLAPPTITGTPQIGETLILDDGEWSDGTREGFELYAADDDEGTNETLVSDELEPGEWAIPASISLVGKYLRLVTWYGNERGQQGTAAESDWFGPIEFGGVRVDLTAYDAFNIFTTTVSGGTDLTELVVSDDAADFDWSGMSLQFQRGEDGLANAPVVTLISRRVGISADHLGYSATPIAPGDTYFFRTPAGAVVSLVVESTESVYSVVGGVLQLTDTKLIKFTEEAPESLAVYEFEADSETVDYFIAPEHNCTLKLLEVTNYPAYVVLPTAVPRHFYGAQHVDGGWDAGAVASSGRPCFVPYDDGTMRLYGHHSAEMFCTTYQSQADDIRKLVRYMTRTVTAANPAIESRSMHMGLALSL